MQFEGGNVMLENTFISLGNKAKSFNGEMIDKYRSTIQIPDSFTNAYEIKGNIAYNLQFIEYQLKQLEEMKMTSVITKMTYKNIIISGAGIIEALMFYLIKEAGFQTMSVMQSIKTFSTNETKMNNEKVIMKVEMFKMVPPYEIPMNLKNMIEIAKGKKLLGTNHDVYKDLDQLRDLRNRVHMQLVDEKYDHQFNKFDKNTLNLIKKLLHLLLADSRLCKNGREGIYSYLL